jgi:hypothetical protein
MSDAKVTFEDLDYEPCAAGEETRFSFACPKHAGRRCEGLLIRQNESQHPTWIWDGNRETPTFKPSINCKGCWHGYITKGRCVTTSGRDEPEPVGG